MTITLDERDASYVRGEVERGGYEGPAEVVARALEAMRAEADALAESATPPATGPGSGRGPWGPWTLERLRAELRIGLDQLDRGEGREMTTQEMLAGARRYREGRLRREEGGTR